MRIARVYSGSGEVACFGENPKPVAGTVEIDTPMPSDFNVGSKPYIWNFSGLGWVIDQDKLDKKDAKKSKKDKKDTDQAQINSDNKDLLDDITTDWTDPNGDILKMLVEQMKKLTVDTR